MRKQLIFAVALTACLSVSAQTKDGGISAQMLQQIEKQNTPTASDRALRNALAANAIDLLAKNQANAGALDTYFSVETKKQSITDQKSSGRCWMFSGLNVLRSNFAKRTDSLSVELSQDYLFFWDQLEKANLMLQGVIDTGKKPIDDQRVQFFFHYPISDGGTFCGVADLAEKYGLVPADIQPETYSAENTSKMASIIKSKLREMGLDLRKWWLRARSPMPLTSAKPRCFPRCTTCWLSRWASQSRSLPLPSRTRMARPSLLRRNILRRSSIKRLLVVRSMALSLW